MSAGTDGHLTQGTHHIGLTVSSLDEARRFFVDTLQFKQTGEFPEYPAVFLTDGNTTLTLWQIEDPTQAKPFDRKRVVGLHHLAFLVDGNTALDVLHEKLSAHDRVIVEFAPEQLLDGPSRHMMCRVPGGGIRIEFVSSSKQGQT